MGRRRTLDYEALSLRYIESDLTLREVADEFGCTEAIVRRALKIQGVRRQVTCDRCGVSNGTDPRIRYCTGCRKLATAENLRRAYDNNREHRAEKSARWYRENLERFQETNKAWHRNNRASSNAAIARWKASHPNKLREYDSTRRARELNQFIEPVDPAIVYEMHGGMCGICKEFVSRDDFHVDHVIPLSKGGMHGYINVQPAHPVCNLRKGQRYE